MLDKIKNLIFPVIISNAKNTENIYHFLSFELLKNRDPNIIDQQLFGFKKAGP